MQYILDKTLTYSWSIDDLKANSNYTFVGYCENLGDLFST